MVYHKKSVVRNMYYGAKPELFELANIERIQQLQREYFGIKVIRFTNEQVLYNQNIVIKQINNYISEAASLRKPERKGKCSLRTRTCHNQGEHGYGLRKGKVAAETWPLLAEKWLKNIINAK